MNKSNDQIGVKLTNPQYCSTKDMVFCAWPIEPREGQLIGIAPANCLAGLIPIDADRERIQMLTCDAQGEYDHLINSSWFPLTLGYGHDTAIDALIVKINSLGADRMDDYLEVVKREWGYIEDNFKSDTPEDFESAVVAEKKFQAYLKAQGNS